MTEFAFMYGWLSRQESLALGWTLLHFCWQGTAVAVAYAVVDRLTARARSGVRYLVALAALGLMPLAVVVTFLGQMHTLAPVQSNTTARDALSVATGQPLLLPAVGQHLPALDDSVQSHANWLTIHAEQILPWLDALWMAGVMLLAVRALGGWRQLEHLRRTARGNIPTHIDESLARVCARLQIGRRVALRVSDEVITPMAMGLWRATILLPVSAVLHLTPEELEAVLAHELGHIRRWDYGCNLLQTALETVLFFHPAVWWLSRTVRYRRELCCDEIAVDSCADAIVYARTLLRLEEQKIQQARLAVALNGGGSLLGRVRNILGEEGQMENKMTSGMRVAVAGVILLGLTLGPKWNDAIAAVRPAVDHAITAAIPIAGITEKSQSKPALKASRTDHAASVRGNEKGSSVANEPEIASLAPVPQDASGTAKAQTEAAKPAKGISYIDGMRDAGYALDLNNDLNTLISLKSLGVTPEYAKQMGLLGFGKPSVHELISLKALGVTPEYLAEMKQSGLGPKDFHEAVTEKALGITPEYAAEMKKSGFGDMDMHQLISLKAQGVTPEYVTWLKQQFPQITFDELKRAAVFHLDDKFLADAKSHGFDGKDLDKLLRLKMSGLLDE